MAMTTTLRQLLKVSLHRFLMLFSINELHVIARMHEDCEAT